MTETTHDQAPPATSTDQRAVVVPDKPALEGLEATWSQQWKADDTYRFDRTQPRANVYSIDTPAAHGERQPARRTRLLLHAHRPDRALPADAREVRVLPDGLGRQRPAHRAPGAELLRRPLRPEPPVRRRLHAAREAGRQEAGPDQPTQLRRALRAPGGAGRGDLRVALAHARALRRLEAALHDHRAQGPDGQPARLPAQLRPGRGLPPGGADPLGRHLPDRRGAGRARVPGVRRPLPPGRLPPSGRRPPSTWRPRAPS